MKYFKPGDRVIIVGLTRPENYHLNGLETIVTGIIDKSEACKRLGLIDFTEKVGDQNKFFYELDNFNLKVFMQGSFGGERKEEVNFTVSENLRKIQPKSPESYSEMIQSFKSSIPELV